MLCGQKWADPVLMRIRLNIVGRTKKTHEHEMTVPPRPAGWLLAQLEDPFTMFPVESVADTLFGAVDEAETRKGERMGPFGVVRKYWSVEEEHYHQELGLLVGAVFVLGQAAITQTDSLLTEIGRHPQAHDVVPCAKEDRFAECAAIDPATGLSTISIINSVSNYFKHVYQWPEDWSASSGDANQARTISTARQLGMSPGDMTDNLLIAASVLGLSENNPRAVARSIQGWREAWAKLLYPKFGLCQ